MKMSRENDPKQELFDKFKDIQSNPDEYQVTGAKVLLGTYIRPQKTAGGIYLTEKYIDEDIWQGKVGLIMKMGPYPFEEEDKKFFGDWKPAVGDWVLFRPSDAFSANLLSKDGHVRIIDRFKLIMKVPEPDIVW